MYCLYNKLNKYSNCKVYIGDEKFDSKKEAKRYSELLLLQRAGKISGLKRQVKFVLIPSQYRAAERYGKSGKRLADKRELLEKECAYIADFVYHDCDKGTDVVEDTKGVRTKDYIIKRKLMLFVHGIRISEI